MTRMLPLAALALACLAAPAYAADEVAKVGDTAIVLPWGTWLAAIMPSVASAAVTALTGLATVYLKRFAPVWISALLQSRIETMVQTAVAYAINDVAGATRNGVLTIPVGSAVIAKALQRIIDSTPAWLLKLVPGGLPELGNRVFRSLDLEPDSTAARVLEPALRNLGVAAR